MKAVVVLEKSSDYEILSLSGQEDPPRASKVLVIERKTETGELFRVVAGYYLGQKEKYDDESSLVEIEIVPMSEHSRIKTLLRGASDPQKRKAPITFW
jgi:hypothetical protein